MLFYTQAYLLFFLIVFVVYWCLPWARARVGVLLAASFFFYASWSQWLALLVSGTAILDYLLARSMDGTTSRNVKRLFLGTSLTMNLGVLAYFKYVNFFIDSLKQSLAAFGASTDIPLLEVIIPFGISFYTFEAISYTIDVYRGKIRAERNLLHFLLFILFFPHLVAGPIVRAHDFLPQIRRTKRFNWLRVQVGVEYFLIGLFKKVVIADSMALYSDPVFAKDADPAELGTPSIWLGVLAYAIRIYCDFSGYSDMAIGSAHLIGYKLTLNFQLPYLAANVQEFWRRWHISLSTWLRDYLFIPLGGSRGSRWFTARNLLITMTLGGLWHGANWSYVLWGVLHGLLLIGHRWFQGWCVDRPRLNAVLQSFPGTLLRIATTFFCVMLCWVFFQPSLERALFIVQRMFEPVAGTAFPVTKGRLWFCLTVLLIGQLLLWSGWWQRVAPRIPAPAMGLAYALLLILTFVLTPDTQQVFIYFQF